LVQDCVCSFSSNTLSTTYQPRKAASSNSEGPKTAAFQPPTKSLLATLRRSPIYHLQTNPRPNQTRHQNQNNIQKTAALVRQQPLVERAALVTIIFRITERGSAANIVLSLIVSCDG